MENNYRQNCCVMTTSIDDKTGKTLLTYIPLSLDISVVEYLFKNGKCENKNVCEFEINQSAEDFWKTMWKDLEGQCEWD